MQTSMVFSERTWWGEGDVDGCWLVSGIQAVNVTSPWLHLVGAKTFRKAANNPDVQGEANGGTLTDIKRGIEGCYPSLVGHVKARRGVGWGELVRALDNGNPVSVAIDSGKQPADLQFGFQGLHQITLARPDRLMDTPKVLYANPLAKAGSRWLTVKLDLLRDAVMSYGAQVTGNRGAWFVILPTDDEALDIRHTFTDDTPFDQDDIDEATAELQAKIDAALEALGD